MNLKKMDSMKETIEVCNFLSRLSEHWNKQELTCKILCSYLKDKKELEYYLHLGEVSQKFKDYYVDVLAFLSRGTDELPKIQPIRDLMKKYGIDC